MARPFPLTAVFTCVRPLRNLDRRVVEQDGILFLLEGNKIPSCSTTPDGRTHLKTDVT